MKMGIMNKMMLTILVPSLLGLAAVCGLSYWQAEHSLTEQVAHEFDSVIDKQIEGLGSVQQMTHGLIRTNAESALIAEFPQAVPDSIGAPPPRLSPRNNPPPP